jgi:hypothetical protein
MQSWIPAARNVNEWNRHVIAHLIFRGGFHIVRAVNSCNGTSIGLLTNNQEIGQVIRISVLPDAPHKPTTIASKVCCPRCHLNNNTQFSVLPEAPHKPTTISTNVCCPRPYIVRRVKALKPFVILGRSGTPVARPNICTYRPKVQVGTWKLMNIKWAHPTGDERKCYVRYGPWGDVMDGACSVPNWGVCPQWHSIHFTSFTSLLHCFIHFVHLTSLFVFTWVTHSAGGSSRRISIHISPPRCALYVNTCDTTRKVNISHDAILRWLRKDMVIFFSNWIGRHWLTISRPWLTNSRPWLKILRGHIYIRGHKEEFIYLLKCESW